MNEVAYKNLISGNTKGLAAALARLALSVLEIAYQIVIAARNQMFDMGLRRSKRATVPVISVGNVTTGGTGKTPVVALLVTMLQKHGMSPGIISRGYRSVDGVSNDEKLVLERLCPDVPHEQNALRIEAAARVTANSSVNVIVMDDGFQHRQLHRDMNVVLIDATNPFGYGHQLPRGLLREPLSALRRADVVLVTRSDMVPQGTIESIERRICQIAPELRERLFRIDFRAVSCINGRGERFSMEELSQEPTMLVSGIGNPEAFADTCRRANQKIAGTRWFPDHHHYTENDRAEIEKQRQELGARRIMTTLKDLVKMPSSGDYVALEIAATFPIPGQKEVMESLLKARLSHTQ